MGIDLEFVGIGLGVEGEVGVVTVVTTVPKKTLRPRPAFM